MDEVYVYVVWVGDTMGQLLNTPLLDDPPLTEILLGVAGVAFTVMLPETELVALQVEVGLTIT